MKPRQPTEKMSPRRKFEPDEGALLAPQSIELSRWGLPLALTASALRVMAAAMPSLCAHADLP